jgi:transposase
MGQISLMSGPERRRRWSVEQKRELVAAAFAPGASVTEVARRAAICTGLIYRWRRDFQTPETVTGFAPAVLLEDRGFAPRSRPEEASLVVELNGARVTVAADMPVALVTAVLRALR